MLCMATLGMLIALPSGAQEALELLPNLEALPATDISIVTSRTGVQELRFSASTWNSGAGPLELVAGETGQGRQNIYQRVFVEGGGSYDRLAGTFVWHEGHAHFHFEDYAKYTLQRISGKGNSQRDAAKTTFCVMDTDLIDGSLPGSPGSAQYDDCGEVLQGMSVGWGDEYGHQLPGQEFDLTKLKDGDYRLIIEADPRNRILESDDGDNLSCVLLRLQIAAGIVDVLNPGSCDDPGAPPPGGGGEVTVDAITPDEATVGSIVAVEITGAGFTEGLDIRFTNGEGSRPVASEVTFRSATLYTATVTVRRRGGSKPDNVWDLEVGGAVLPDAFTVLPE